MNALVSATVTRIMGYQTVMQKYMEHNKVLYGHILHDFIWILNLVWFVYYVIEIL